MPRLIDSESRADALIAAVNHILSTEGLPGLTIRRVAQVSRVAASSVLHHLGSRERLLAVSASHTARNRRHRFLAAEAGYGEPRGLLALLPASPDEVVDARIWLAWLELWRCDPAIAPIFDHHMIQMRGLLAELTGHRFAPDKLSATLALADGLT
ncbi:MAG: hypothetical protein L0H93_17100, partial [Nocardioides sp.]|nr:hypothetical protein [Nocardioides sp.]